MLTCGGKVYHSDKLSIDMDPNASSSSITSSTDSFIPEILKTLQEIKAQVNIFVQRMDRIEVERRGQDRNENR